MASQGGVKSIKEIVLKMLETHFFSNLPYNSAIKKPMVYPREIYWHLASAIFK